MHLHVVEVPMRAAIQLWRQGAKCVGAPPGRGQGCPPTIQTRCITGRSGRGRARPWPGPVPCHRAPGARTFRGQGIAPGEQTYCAGRRQSARCDLQASPSSAARFAEHGKCSGSTDARNSRSATAPIPPAARPSRTSAAARYTKAAASTCANTPGTGSAALQRDCATLHLRRDRPCGGSSHVATVQPICSAGTPLGGRPQGSCPGRANADRGT